MGKRIIGIILVCACLIGLIGCAAEPANRPYDKEPKTGGATLADFGTYYENGELAYHTDLVGNMNRGKIGVEYRGPLDAEDLAYQTWRGIRLLDSMEQVLEAYKDWGLPNEVSFVSSDSVSSKAYDSFSNLDQLKELNSKNWAGQYISGKIVYTWYCNPGTCDFIRKPQPHDAVEYTICFNFDNGELEADIKLTKILIQRKGKHPEVKKTDEKQMQDQQPSQFQGEILEDISEKEFGLYMEKEPSYLETATKKFPYITYGIDKYTEDSNTLRGVGYGSSVKEVIDAYGDFKLSLVWTKNPLDPLPKEQWEGYTLEKYANNNMDFLKNCEIVYLEFGIQKQGEIWSVCTRDRYKEKEPLEEVTEYWLSICLENGKVSNIYLDSKYLGERDLDALYAQIQEERGLTVSN